MVPWNERATDQDYLAAAKEEGTMAKAKYTQEELEALKVADLIADAEFAERQAEEGPFYPDRDITRESLLAYAARCRRAAKGESK